MGRPKRKSRSRKHSKPRAIDVYVREHIRELRLLREMTQVDLAKQVGVRFRQVQKYEVGFNRVSAVVCLCAEALDVKL